MSRTDIDAASLAAYLRRMCGDGSVEWSYEPMQTSVLLDIADMLDESARLRELCHEMLAVIIGWGWKFNELSGHKPEAEGTYPTEIMRSFISRARELGVQL